ncbi:MAG: polyphosphate kinase 1 [Saprospiraceae bacterium]|nr:polyphosphate kinase 1 [Saprospiraceae bacterium]
MLIKLENLSPYIHRDISWLSFNYRVLQESKDPNVPLLERIKFLAIYSSNLDEFFRVRVSNHKNLVRAGRKTFKNLEFEPARILNEILRTVNVQQEEFSRIFEKEIIPELKEHNIYIRKQKQLNAEQTEFIESLFNEKIIQFAQPVLLREDKIRPFLSNGSLYLALYMRSKNTENKKKYYAIVKVPSDQMERFVVIPSREKNKKELMLLDDIVRYNVVNIFPGFTIQNAYSIKLTRDAELYIDDEYSGDLLEKIKKSLAKRDVGLASRLVYDRNMPKHFINYLMKVFDLETIDLLPEGKYHNNSDFFKFPSFGMDHLKDIDLEPLAYAPIETSESIFDVIKERDHMLYFPFHSYESVIRFFEDAAEDPHVTHIKILQYRVASTSRIMDALMKATKNGKQVTAFIEIKARFDEKANLSWGEKLEKAGVTVLYSMPGLKVHSKMAIIRRVIEGKEEVFTYLSTGNFHENTSKLYTDFGYFTHDPRIVGEAMSVFSFIETKIRPQVDFKYMGVGTFNLKPKLIELVNNEIDNAKNGKKASITLKMNSLQDDEMIDLLYKASEAGVTVKMIIRGICCLVPQMKGISEKIKAYSIVDRYLEHARVFIFHNEGNEHIYLSSADWMVRNLHHRIETMFPVFDEEIRKFVKTIIKIQLNDNVKSRYHNFELNNPYRRNAKLPVRSQVDTYYYIKRQEENRDK